MELEQKAKRLENNTIFFPQHYWEWIGVKNGKECTIGIDKGRHGKYIAIYIKKEEPKNENIKTI